MKLIRNLLIILLFSANAATADDDSIVIENKTYHLEFPSAPFLSLGSRRVEGEFESKVGPISQWQFRIRKVNGGFNDGIEVIVNEKSKRILYVKNNVEAGGPFLRHDLDPDYIIFDYGTATGERGFELRAVEDGTVVFKDEYWSEEGGGIGFINGGILYAKASAEKISPDVIGKYTQVNCTQMGGAVKIERFEYNIASRALKKRTNRPAFIECVE